MQAEYGIDAKPAQHEKINTWRNNFEGVQYLHEPTNLLISGAIDDLWINDKSEYIVVDYKATAKNRDDAVRELNDSVWHQAYKRQMEVYQWLLRHNDLKVSDTGYFVYCTGIYDQESFDKKIEFEVNLIPYQGNDDWIEDVIFKIHKCLESDTIPESSQGCELCMYFKTRQEKEKDKQDEALFQKAKRIALNTGKISASTLQKKLRISFAQSARILDMLEKAGVINPTTKVD
jgi:DNA segregation ATPase FtsK/SpoIIIE-like protein